MAMATRRLAAGGPAHGTRVAAQPGRVRSFLFDSELVSRLHRVLRRLRGRKKLYAVVAQVRRKPILKKDVGEPGGMTIPTRSARAGVDADADASYVSAGRRSELVFNIRSRVVDVVNDAEEAEE